MNYLKNIQSWLIEKWELAVPIFITLGRIIKYYCLEGVGLLLLLIDKLGIIEMTKDIGKFIVPCIVFTVGLNLLFGLHLNLLALSLVLVGICKIITLLIIYLFFPDKK